MLSQFLKKLVALHTVRNYISSILRKLELRDRTQLAIWAVQNQNSQPEAEV